MVDERLTPERQAKSKEISFPTAMRPSEAAVEEALRIRSTQQGLLVEVNTALAGAIEVEPILGQVLSRLTERARLINASIYLLDREKRQLHCVAQSGYPYHEAYASLEMEGPGVIAWAARTGEAVYVPDVTKDPRGMGADPRAKSVYAVPLWARSNVLGVLNIESDQEVGIRAVTRKLVEQFAAQAALAIERGELYKKLRASEERFRSIFEQGHFGIALCDLEGRLSAVNPAFAQTLGYEPRELVGLRYSEITHPADRQESLQRVGQVWEGKTDRFMIEKQYLRKTGESVWCTAIVSVIRDPSGSPAYTLAMIQDISERKKAEEERARLREQLFRAQKMEAMGTLAGGIAHDFNNLLGVILGYASLVRRRLRPDDALHEPIGMIVQSAERARELTRQLLHFARQGTFPSKLLNLAEVLNRVLRIVTQTFDRRIQVEAHLAADLPLIEGDAGQLELAILNLCINARDAMPEGGTLAVETFVVTLGAEDPLRPPQCPPDDYIRIVIKDTGVGMEPQILERIFEPFFTTKEPGKGSGLGLAMVYGIVSNHGGSVRAASQVGQGSEFTIHLPVATGLEELPAEKPFAPAERGTGTVLVVDDEPLMLAFAEDALKELGYKALTAEDGARACEIYARGAQEIDAVLLDMVMPGMGWLETLQALRAVNPRASVILTSGYSGGEEARRGLEAGAAAFLGKPYTVDALAKVLKSPEKNSGSGEGHKA